MFGLMLSGGTVAALVAAGLILRNRRMENSKKIYSTVLAFSSLLVLTGAIIALFSGTSVAADEAVAAASEISIGAGLGFIAAAAATAIACVGAGFAVANVGSAAMGLVGEKPEMLGTTLIYLGLAEGIAIYGVIVSLLIIQKL